MKIIFLDIDGVLNTVSAEYGFKHALGLDLNHYHTKGDDVLRRISTAWCPAALGCLYRIIKETGAKIVISSTWRYGCDLEDMKAWFQVPLLRDAVIDKTRSIYPKLSETDVYVEIPRGSECKAWIEEYHKKNGRGIIQRIALIDDDSDMWPLQRDFFQTDGYTGLTWDLATKIIEHLNRGNDEDKR